MNPRIHTLLLAVAFATAAAGVAAQEKKAKAATPKAATQAAPQAAAPQAANTAMCIGCHGLPGYKTAFPEVYHVPKIAGQNPAYIESALKAYRAGQRPHPSMRGIAGGLTDEQITAFAQHYGGAAK
jgi:cytochrome c553